MQKHVKLNIITAAVFPEYTNFKNDLIGHDDKNCEACRGKYKSCDCFLEYTNFKDDLIEYKCLYCKIF